MSLAAKELYLLAKRVTETHNGKHYPQAVKTEAMTELREFIASLAVSTSQPEPSKVQASFR